MKAVLYSSAISTLLVMVTGCGGSAEQVETYRVSGQVVFGDAPAGEGTITFIDSATGYSKAYEMGSDSEFSVDLTPGDYQASVTPPPKVGEQGEFTDAEEIVEPTETIPLSAFRAETSGLRVTVGNERISDLKLNLQL